MAGRPRGHVGARVGRHVWLDIEGERRILIGESVPLFNRILSPYFLCVGLCSHTVSVLQDAWRREERQIEAEISDRVDPSPRDHPSKHVLKKGD